MGCHSRASVCVCVHIHVHMCIYSHIHIYIYTYGREIGRVTVTGIGTQKFERETERDVL